MIRPTPITPAELDAIMVAHGLDWEVLESRAVGTKTVRWFPVRSPEKNATTRQLAAVLEALLRHSQGKP